MRLIIENEATRSHVLDRMIFKLSNYRAYMEIGADPEFRGIGLASAKGGEYLMFEQLVGSMKLLNEQIDVSMYSGRDRQRW